MMIHPGHVPALMRLYGKDIVVQAGGGVHGHPGGTRTGATAMRQAVDARMKGKTLREYAKTHPELEAVVKQWGVVK